MEGTPMSLSENLDLLSWTAPQVAAVATKPTIEQRFALWSVENAHVLAELLRLARAQLAQGATFISTKALWEACRVSLSAGKEGGYKLNNTFTASAARWLIEQEPRLVGVIETRQRRSK
jgi:hypothetical protein